MPKTTEKTVKEPTVTVRIVPGEVTPAMKTAWRKLFSRLIAECQRELKLGSETKK